MTSLNEININDEDLLKTFQGIGIHKMHGHENFSMRMIKICDQAITGVLSIISKTVLHQEFSQIFGKIKYCFSP